MTGSHYIDVFELAERLTWNGWHFVSYIWSGMDSSSMLWSTLLSGLHVTLDIWSWVLIWRSQFEIAELNMDACSTNWLDFFKFDFVAEIWISLTSYHLGPSTECIKDSDFFFWPAHPTRGEILEPELGPLVDKASLWQLIFLCTFVQWLSPYVLKRSWPGDRVCCTNC